MAEGSTASRGFPPGGLPTGAIVVAIILAFAGADVLSAFKPEPSSVATPFVADPASLGGKVHISFCQS